MQNITSSFARDWQFVKISRSWKPHDFSKEILEKLLQENDRNINEMISKIVFDLGRKEGREIKNRLGGQMEINTVIEGILLISGQEYIIKKNDEKTEIVISKSMKNKDNLTDGLDTIFFPYIKGVIRSIIPDSHFLDSGEELTIYF
jgi:hypothetical protein